jgi:tRNA (guanine10-N2)-dimethyltransferase|tara:strand:- start:788 stop:1813 length:1026 start_codon:yes stop_codon:yes gene_type:complete
LFSNLDVSKRSLFILSGEKSTIPLGELEALVKTYSHQTEINVSCRRVVIVNGPLNPTVISKRAAFIRLGGIYIGSMDLPLDETFKEIDFTELPTFKSFAARIHNFSKVAMRPEVEGSLGYAVKKTFPSAKVSLKSPDILVVGVMCDDIFHICAVDTASTLRSWTYRRPRIRPFFHPSALYSKFARLLVNLAQVKNNDLLLDPFCGTGSIIIEAGEIGVRSIGIDISRRMCNGTLKNLKHFDTFGSGIVHSDVAQVPLLRVDGVATDIPYGRASSTHKRKTESLAEDLIANLEILLPAGRQACIVHPDTIDILDVGGLERVQQHIIPVNRSLTRMITILKRV